jgi:hypothetical protein
MKFFQERDECVPLYMRRIFYIYFTDIAVFFGKYAQCQHFLHFEVLVLDILI